MRVFYYASFLCIPNGLPQCFHQSPSAPSFIGTKTKSLWDGARLLDFSLFGPQNSFLVMESASRMLFRGRIATRDALP